MSPQIHPRRPLDDLLHDNHYSAEELADLLEVSVDYIRHEVRRGQLKGYVVDHQVLDIRREDVIDWFHTRR